MFRRHLLAVMGVLLLGAFTQASAVGATEKITVAYATAADFLPAFVAKDKGIFEKNGLDVTLKAIPVASVVPAALVSNSVQIGMNTVPNILLAAEGGIDLVAIVGAARLLKSNPRVSLVTRPGVTVTKAEDLKGKKVGVPGISSTMDIVLRKWLLNHKVPLDQVTFVEIPFPQMGDMLKAGQVDAVAAIEPLLSRIVATKSGVKSIDYFSEVTPDTLGAFWAATRDWATKHRATIDAFKKSIAEGTDWIKKNPEEARKIEVKYLGFAGKVLPAISPEMKRSDFEFFEEIGREVGLMRKPVDVDRLIWK